MALNFWVLADKQDSVLQEGPCSTEISRTFTVPEQSMQGEKYETYHIIFPVFGHTFVSLMPLPRLTVWYVLVGGQTI
jgi:hypothetical protein